MASDVSLSLSLWFCADVSDCACTSEPDISAIVASTVASASKDGSRVLRNCWIAAIVVAVVAVAVAVCAVCVRRRHCSLSVPSLLLSSVVTFVSFHFAFPLSLADYFAEPENGGSAAVTCHSSLFGIWYLARDTNTNTGDTGVQAVLVVSVSVFCFNTVSSVLVGTCCVNCVLLYWPPSCSFLPSLPLLYLYL